MNLLKLDLILIFILFSPALLSETKTFGDWQAYAAQNSGIVSSIAVTTDDHDSKLSVFCTEKNGGGCYVIMEFNKPCGDTKTTPVLIFVDAGAVTYQAECIRDYLRIDSLDLLTLIMDNTWFSVAVPYSRKAFISAHWSLKGSLDAINYALNEQESIQRGVNWKKENDNIL